MKTSTFYKFGMAILVLSTVFCIALYAGSPKPAFAQDGPQGPPEADGGYDGPRPNPERIFKDMDANGDGMLSLTEFTDFHEKMGPGAGPERNRKEGPQGFGAQDDRQGPPQCGRESDQRAGREMRGPRGGDYRHPRGYENDFRNPRSEGCALRDSVPPAPPADVPAPETAPNTPPMPPMPPADAPAPQAGPDMPTQPPQPPTEEPVSGNPAPPESRIQ